MARELKIELTAATGTVQKLEAWLESKQVIATHASPATVTADAADSASQVRIRLTGVGGATVKCAVTDVATGAKLKDATYTIREQGWGGATFNV